MDGICIRRIICKSGKLFGVAIKKIQSAAPGADPQIAFAVFCYIQHFVRTQGMAVVGVVFEMLKCIVAAIEEVQSAAIGTDPQVALIVFAKRFYIAVAYAVGAGLLSVQGELLYIGCVQVQSAPVCAYPQIALVVFEQSRHRSLRQADDIIRLIGIMKETICFWFEQIQSAIYATDPYIPFFIDQ